VRGGGLAALMMLAATLGCRPSSQSAEPATEVANQVLKNFELQDLQNGAKAMTLEASEGRIFERSKVAELSEPRVTFYKLGQVSSHMTAPYGKVYTETREMDAWGGVTVTTTDSATLTTERLHYDPKKREISSDDPVRLEKVDSVTEGKGLRTDPELKSVRIREQIVRLKDRPKS
jgi:LPS export ABC transporter protein LptC